MDELTFFFDDLPSEGGSSNSGVGKSAVKQPHIQAPLVDQTIGDVTETNMASSLAISKKLHEYLQPRSLPNARDLPLSLPSESDDGNIEYKLKLINPSPERLEHLVTQMKWRLNEGNGQAIYRLGVDDNGDVTGLTAKEMAVSLLTLCEMALRLGVDIRVLRECSISNPNSSNFQSMPVDAKLPFSPQKKAVELEARWKESISPVIPAMRVAMLGSVDVGKSTLVGILADGEMDDGRGRARLHLFHHVHEILSGRTSSLSSELIGFDETDHLVNRRRFQGRLNKRTVDEVICDSNRLITFIDLAGHSKYQRITLCGLITFRPAYCILVVSATTGLTAEGLCHARIAAALGLPIVVVLSKVDLISEIQAAYPLRKLSVASAAHLTTTAAFPYLEAARKNVIQELKTIKIYSGGDGDGNSLKATECFSEDPPVFAVSSVSGFGLGNLLKFLARVSSRRRSEILVSRRLSTQTKLYSDQSMLNLVECWVTKIFKRVPNVDSPVLEVLVKMGRVYEDQRLWLGPDEEGRFHLVRIIELRLNRHPHRVLHEDQLGSVLAAAEASDGAQSFLPRRGMVMVNAEPTTEGKVKDPSIAVCWSFCISNLIWIAPGVGSACLQHNSTVGLHTGNVTQYARVLETTFSCDQLIRIVDNHTVTDSNSVILRLDSSHKVIVTFLQHPEFLELGRQVVISVNNEARVVGTVAGFRDVITVFLSPSPQLPSPKAFNSTLSNSSSSWRAMSDSSFGFSYESLLSQINIDPQGPRTYYIDETPLLPETEPFKDLTQHGDRIPYYAKRRNKKAAPLATIAASSLEVLPSTSI